MKVVKEELAAALAHEVKNPVSLIKANIDYIREEKNLEECDKNFKVIDRELGKIDSLIKDFTVLSRDTVKESMEKIFVEDLINDVVESYDISIQRKKIEFDIKSRREDIACIGDYNKISILFFNIIKNAVEAIDSEGCIEINIDENDEYITVEVMDNGEGIKEDMLGIIGKPFMSTKEDGSGLGIAICKSIVEEHNGRFSIGNREEGGCVVRIELEKD